MVYANNIITETKKHLRRYEYDEAIACCDRILEVNPQSVFGLRFKAISYYQTDRYREALKYYYKVYEIYPDDMDAKYSIAMINEILQNYDEALLFYDKLTKNEETLSKRKRLLTKTKKYDQIIGEYDKLLHEIRNTKSVSNVKRKIVLLEEKAIFQFRNHEYEKAYTNMEKVFPLYSTIGENFFHKKDFDLWYGFVNECINNSANAWEFFDRFLNLEKSMEMWYIKINHSFSEYEDRLVFTDLLLELDGDNVELLENIAENTRYTDGDYALDCWKRILELEPENTRAIEAILNIYSTMYAKDRELDLIDKSLHIEDIRLKLLVRKIRLLESMTLYDEALEVYDEYLSIEKDDGVINHQLTEFDRLRCMEQQAVELYLAGHPSESYAILKEVSQIYRNIEKNPSRIRSEEWTLEDWYTMILMESVNKTDNNAERFFEEFYKLNDKKLAYWKEKIDFLINWKHFGNPLAYCSILMQKNRTYRNKLLLIKGYVYYRTKRMNRALDVYDKVLAAEPGNNEAKNYKFNILIQKEEYIEAYDLLESMQMDYKLIRHDLNRLANELLKNKEYERALTCYKMMVQKELNFKNIDTIKYIWEKTRDKESQKGCKYYMDWINLIEDRRDPQICPECGSKLIPIIYGLPVSGMINSEKNGEEYVLGGCCVSNDSPTDYCKSCQKSIFMEAYGIEITKDDPELYVYCQNKIRDISGIIEKHPQKSIAELKQELLTNGIGPEEFEALLEKLEEIGHIEMNDNHLILLEKDDKNKFGPKRPLSEIEEIIFNKKIK